MPNSTILACSENTASVRIEFGADELAEAKTRSALAMGRSMTIAPHARGEAPAEAIIRRFGDALITNAAAEALFKQHAAAQILQIGLVASGPATLATSSAKTTGRKHMGVISESGDLVIELTVPVSDTVDVDQVLSNVYTYTPSTSDAYIEDRINAVRNSVANVVGVDRPAQAGDVVIVNVSLHLDPDGKPEENFPVMPVRVGASNTFAGVSSDVLVGAVAGTSGESRVDMNTDFPVKSVAGKLCTVRYSVVRVEDHILPALDDEFAVSCGYANMAAMRERIHQQWVSENPNIEYWDRRSAVISGIANLYKLDRASDEFQSKIRAVLTAIYIKMGLTFGEADYLAVAARSRQRGDTAEETLLRGLKTTPNYKTKLRIECTLDWLIKNAKY